MRAGLGGTINDVVLTAITRGFRDLLLSRGEPVEGRTSARWCRSRCGRNDERGRCDNRVSAVFADLPVGLDDPVARLAAVRADMEGVKKSKGAVAGARLTELSGFAPPVLLAAGQRLATSVPQTSFHTVTTNVPGPQRPLYFAGRRMISSAPTIPLAASLRTAVGIFSYDGGLHFGLTGDYDTVPDLAVLARGIEAGVAELVELANATTSNRPARRGRYDLLEAPSRPPRHRRRPSGGRGPTATPTSRAQRFHSDGAWHDVSFSELREISTEIGLGLVDLGVQPGDRVSVLSDTRPEWVQVEFGVALAGGVVVPIYPSSSADECEWVLSDSGAVVVVCENAAQAAKVEQVRERLPDLRHVVLMDGLDELRARGAENQEQRRAELDRRTEAVQPDDPALIIYTSGTTGRPKGCVLTHRNLTSCCRVCDDLDVLGAEDVVYLFLPLAHVFAQVIALAAAGMGSVTAFCSGDASKIMPDLAALSPTVVPSVPRIFEKVYASVSGMVPAEMRAQAVAAGMAVRALERAGREVPDALRAGFDQADAALFGKVRAIFGGSVRQAISGAAPIAPEILEFFHAAGVPVNEGYGLSESTAIGTLNTLDAVRIGSIGRGGARLRGPDRRRRRDPHARPAHLRRVLEERPRHRRDAGGRLAAHR